MNIKQLGLCFIIENRAHWLSQYTVNLPEILKYCLNFQVALQNILFSIIGPDQINAPG